METGYEEAYTVAEERHPWFVARRELFASLAGQDRGGRILDVGCGTGIFLVELKRRGYTHLAGVETSAKLRAKFRDRAIELFAELPGGPYDQIFLLDVLEHVEDDTGMLDKLHALLEPGGRLLMSVPAHPSLWSRHDELNRHHRRYRKRELREKLRAAGFRLRRLSYWNMLSFPPIWLLRQLRLSERKNQLEIGGPLAMRLYAGVLRLENRILGRASLPMGVSLIAVAEKGDGANPKKAKAKPKRSAIRRSANQVTSRLVALLLLAACGGVETRPPNVLLISLDTCRRDHLSSYGYERQTTPHIDALAEDGHLFTQAVAVSNWTLPTHASMLTGLYPRTHGAQHRLSRAGDASGPEQLGRLQEDCSTLAEILIQEGFRTGAIVANSVYLQPKLGFAQGFQHFDYRQPGPPLYYRRAEEITEEAISWISEARGTPFFLFLNYMDPHYPYLPPPAYDLRYSGETKLRRWYKDWKSFQNRLERAYQEPLTEEEAAFFRDQYDAEISYMDEQIGRLLTRLRQMGIYDDTLVIVVSDHGEAFGEHGIVSHGTTLYEHQTAVPLIVKTALRREPARVDVPVSQVDILPTVLSQLGIAVPEAVQGASLFRDQPQDLFAEVNPLAAQSRGHRLAVYRGSLKGIRSTGGGWQLFDLSSDPGEVSDLGATEDAMTAPFEQSLRRWLASTPAAGPSAPAEGFSDSELEALRALGYVH